MEDGSGGRKEKEKTGWQLYPLPLPVTVTQFVNGP